MDTTFVNPAFVDRYFGVTDEGKVKLLAETWKPIDRVAKQLAIKILTTEFRKAVTDQISDMDNGGTMQIAQSFRVSSKLPAYTAAVAADQEEGAEPAYLTDLKIVSLGNSSWTVEPSTAKARDRVPSELLYKAVARAALPHLLKGLYWIQHENKSCNLSIDTKATRVDGNTLYLAVSGKRKDPEFKAQGTTLMQMEGFPSKDWVNRLYRKHFATTTPGIQKCIANWGPTQFIADKLATHIWQSKVVPALKKAISSGQLDRAEKSITLSFSHRIQSESQDFRQAVEAYTAAHGGKAKSPDFSEWLRVETDANGSNKVVTTTQEDPHLSRQDLYHALFTHIERQLKQGVAGLLANSEGFDFEVVKLEASAEGKHSTSYVQQAGAHLWPVEGYLSIGFDLKVTRENFEPGLEGTKEDEDVAPKHKATFDRSFAAVASRPVLKKNAAKEAYASQGK